MLKNIAATLVMLFICMGCTQDRTEYWLAKKDDVVSIIELRSDEKAVLRISYPTNYPEPRSEIVEGTWGTYKQQNMITIPNAQRYVWIDLPRKSERWGIRWDFAEKGSDLLEFDKMGVQQIFRRISRNDALSNHTSEGIRQPVDGSPKPSM